MSEKIFNEVKKFEKSLPENFKAVVEIDSKKIFLENISEIDDNILVIEGKEIPKQADLKFFVSKNNLNFILYAVEFKNNKTTDVTKRKIISRAVDIF